MKTLFALMILFLSFSALSGDLVFVTKLRPVTMQIFSVNLYVKPNGNDSNSGSSWNNAIRTLTRANQILVAMKPNAPVNVYLASGNYGNQTVKWTYFHPTYKTSIRAYNKNDRPVFNGCSPHCVEDDWFRFSSSPGSYSNIELYYIKVQNYRIAVTFKADRDDFTRYNGKNRVYGCYFRRIGSEYNGSGSDVAQAVVRFVNSRDNSVANNHFIHVDNKGWKWNGYMHAIYLAHYASGNIIERNRFKNNTGEPLKTRDSADFNIFRDNTFISVTSGSIYFEKYCDERVRSDCTKSFGECPSQGNEVRNNLVQRKWWQKKPKLFVIEASAIPAPHCLFPVQPRLRTSGNVYEEI